MSALENLENQLSDTFARGGWVLTERNKYDLVYELATDPGTKIQFTKLAFKVYKGKETIKEITSNVFLPGYIADMPLTIINNQQIY
jgi:hypothetical protein